MEQIVMLPYAAERRKQLWHDLDRLNPKIAGLDQRLEEEVRKRSAAEKLQTHPGVGPVTALAMVLTLGPADRFHRAKQAGSYLG